MVGGLPLACRCPINFICLTNILQQFHQKCREIRPHNSTITPTNAFELQTKVCNMVPQMARNLRWRHLVAEIVLPPNTCSRPIVCNNSTRCVEKPGLPHLPRALTEAFKVQIVVFLMVPQLFKPLLYPGSTFAMTIRSLQQQSAPASRPCARSSFLPGVFTDAWRLDLLSLMP